MSKPSWIDRPEWANWLAMDQDGEWYWYENEPSPGPSVWKMSGGRVEYAGNGSEWSSSLEPRP